MLGWIVQSRASAVGGSNLHVSKIRDSPAAAHLSLAVHRVSDMAGKRVADGRGCKGCRLKFDPIKLSAAIVELAKRASKLCEPPRVPGLSLLAWWRLGTDAAWLPSSAQSQPKQRGTSPLPNCLTGQIPARVPAPPEQHWARARSVLGPAAAPGRRQHESDHDPMISCPDHGFGIGRWVVKTGASPGPRQADSEQPLRPRPRGKEDNKSLENNAGSGSRARPALGINICYGSSLSSGDSDHVDSCQRLIASLTLMMPRHRGRRQRCVTT